MNGRDDLTRWNRGGLRRFTYVDGNAVEYLEILRTRLVANFGERNGSYCEWLNPPEKVPPNERPRDAEAADEQPLEDEAPNEWPRDGETLIEWQERLAVRHDRVLQTYAQERRDWAWEISRAFARCCHILTGYAGAYANEAFLGTATQWEHVRRLVEMLDYHPAPPASAHTWLAFTAKEGMRGKLPKGFQVKNSPPRGAAKVIFETLDELEIDPALNGLRPKGWNRSGDPTLPGGNPVIEPPPGGGSEFSAIADGPVINLEGVGAQRRDLLNATVERGDFRIRDFVDLDPLEWEKIGINVGWLCEFRAKALAIVNFSSAADWSEVRDWPLPRILSEDPAKLAGESGNTADEVADLQCQVGLIRGYLDQPIFESAILAELLGSPEASVPGTAGDTARGIETPWLAASKPKPKAGEVALVHDRSKDLAEAVSIDRIDEATDAILLQPNPLQNTWGTWPKGDAVLRVSSNWKRKCWLNGRDVIRTEDPHGLGPEAYIGWEIAGQWYFARVDDADKMNLRLNLLNSVEKPHAGKNLYELRPIEGKVIPADHEAIVLLGDEQPPIAEPVKPTTSLPVSAPPRVRPDEIFKLNKVLPGELEGADPGGGGGLLPPASLPKIGSFLFPSPMLPMDLVKVAVELMLSIGVMVIPSTGEIVIKGIPLEGLLEGAESPADAADLLYQMLDQMKANSQKCDDEGNPLWLRVTGDSAPYDALDDASYLRDADGNLIPDQPADGKLVDWKILDNTGEPDTAAIIEALEQMLTVADGDETVLFQEIANEVADKGPLLAIPKSKTRKARVAASEPRYLFNGVADRIGVSDWVVGRFDDGIRALQIDRIKPFRDADKTETFALEFRNFAAVDSGLELVFANFRSDLEATGADRNANGLDGSEIELEGPLPDGLRVGRPVLITGCGDPVQARITAIDGNRIEFDPPVSGCRLGELVIHGNVVTAGHGETKPPKILGSGNAALTHQEFVLEVDAVSFVPDATKPSGVAAALEVAVDGRVWEQVATLKDSNVDDHHYEIRMTEAGYVRIIFGDGHNGRRLPTGANNVVMQYRVGSGTVGNLAAGSLDKAVKPDPLIEAVLQPLPAAGGGDLESIVSLRDNAPATTLALERAVSLSDFGHLATSQSSIWQARAYREIQRGERDEMVKVVFVPAGGASSSQVRRDLRSFLQKHASPGVRVGVAEFDPRRIDLSVTVRVDLEAFVPTEVTAAVAAALTEAFALSRRRLGEDLYLSEVYKVVEGVAGVENSICILNGNDRLRAIEARSPSTVVYLDVDAGSSLVVEYEEYLP